VRPSRDSQNLVFDLLVDLVVVIGVDIDGDGNVEVAAQPLTFGPSKVPS
jgi:hypothetical protein